MQPDAFYLQNRGLDPHLTVRNAQAAASLLQACYLAVIKSIPGRVHIACSGLKITSLLPVANRIDKVDCQEFLCTSLMRVISTTRSKSTTCANVVAFCAGYVKRVSQRFIALGGGGCSSGNPVSSHNECEQGLLIVKSLNQTICTGEYKLGHPLYN